MAPSRKILPFADCDPPSGPGTRVYQLHPRTHGHPLAARTPQSTTRVCIIAREDTPCWLAACSAGDVHGAWRVVEPWFFHTMRAMGGEAHAVTACETGLLDPHALRELYAACGGEAVERAITAAGLLQHAASPEEVPPSPTATAPV